MIDVPQVAATRSSRWRRRGISVASLVLLFCYVVYLAYEWALIPALVDLAIEGMKVAMHQGPAVGTNQYVERFGKSPTQWQAFLYWQLFSWPLLVLSLVIATCHSQSPGRPNARLAWRVGGVALLAVPAVINAGWLAGGAAHQLAPELVGTYWDEPRPDLSMIPWLLLLVALYVTTRRVVTKPAGRAEASHQMYWSDSRFVGWLFVAIGLAGLLEYFEYFGDTDGPSDVFELLVSIPYVLVGIAADIFGAPQYYYTVFLIPYGAIWLRRRRRSAAGSSERWPQVRARQLLLFPFNLVLLAFVILLCVPFGIATLHVWL